MIKVHSLKNDFEERFHQKWTSLSVSYHFKSIVGFVMNIPFQEVNFNLDKPVNSDQNKIFLDLCSRLENNEPIQHIVHETEFMGLSFLCSPDALIPRPETEELVELILDKLNSKASKILDLCTGSGCIAISLAKLNQQAKVQALDFYPETLELAKKNAERNNVEVKWHQNNVLSNSEMSLFCDESYHIWVSNPPYIPESEKNEMDENVLNFEPHHALFVPNDNPFLFYRKISEMAQLGLQNGGWLFFEIHENFGKEMIALLQENNFRNIALQKDMQGKDRMVYGQK